MIHPGYYEITDLSMHAVHSSNTKKQEETYTEQHLPP